MMCAAVLAAHTASAATSANADNPALVAQGRAIYAANCAACHGARLHGQALWQLEDEDSWRRAPALDATGHAWLHPDSDLLQITRSGHYPSAKPGAKSAMPAFAQRLSDDQINATLAYIKAHWPAALRVVQAALNPHEAGAARMSTGTDWRFPPICRSIN